MAEGRRMSIPGYLAAALCAGAVIALPLIAGLVSNSADEFSTRHFSTAPAFGWLACAVLVAIVVTRRLQILLSIEEGSALAIAYDALPILLGVAWIVAIIALISGHWLLAASAAGLCLYHVILVVPRLMTARRPRWTRSAPTIDVVVANVYIDNETPLDAAHQLVAAQGDVVVLVEATASFMTIFDDAGGSDAYPYRVADPDDDSDYAVVIASRSELGPRTLMRRIGPLRLAIADLDVDGTPTLVVALNPMATVDPGGHVTWKEQIEVLKEFVPTLTGPLIIAGDLNTTRYRPEFEELLALGLSDAFDSLGKGLNPSFKLSADGLLSTVGAVARLDHALVNSEMHAIDVRNLEPCGSDHLPFKLHVAVRPSHDRSESSRSTVQPVR